jgi:hypothetical protein
MATILTLTPNPATDICSGVGEIVPARKLRCTAARRDPGEGGLSHYGTDFAGSFVDEIDARPPFAFLVA